MKLRYYLVIFTIFSVSLVVGLIMALGILYNIVMGTGNALLDFFLELLNTF